MAEIYSHSKLSTFEQCKLKYKYRYIDKIKPDVEQTARFEVELQALQKHLNLKIKAKDLNAMRAAVNSYLRLINTIKEVNHND